MEKNLKFFDFKPFEKMKNENWKWLVSVSSSAFNLMDLI